MNRRTTLCLALVASTALPALPPARADEILRLSLDDAITRALDSGTDARIADEQVADAKWSARRTRSDLLPQVDGQIRRASDQLDLLVLGFPAPERIVGPFDVAQATIAASAPLVDMARLRRYRAALAAVDATDADRRVARSEVAFTAAHLYVELLKADALARQIAADVDLFAKVAETAAHQRDAGVGTRLDTTRAQIQLNGRRQALVSARLRREQARTALLEAMGADLGAAVEPTDDLASLDRPLPDLDGSLAAARASRPEFRSLAAEQRMSDLEIGAVAAERYPVLRAQALVSEGGSSIHDLEAVRTVAVTFAVPLFSGGRVRAEMERARSRQRTLTLREEATARSVERSVRDAVEALTAARDRVATAEATEGLADDDLLSVRHRFEAGVTTSVELDNAQTAYAAAGGDLVSARADVAEAWARYEFAVGAIAR
jgi:outer membrane protein